MEQVKDKHLQPILEVLDNKNINGAKLIRKDNRVMLLIDKRKLNKVNLSIMNAMNLVYPNDIVCINNEEAPFDYEELYEQQSEKKNRKVRPYEIYEFAMTTGKQEKEYYEQYLFAGIELDSNRLEPVMQLGYFLEFINALQIQNPLEGEKIEVRKGVEIYSEEQLRRYQHYMQQGKPDFRRINLKVLYNESIQEDECKLPLKDDPYFYRIYMGYLNNESSTIPLKEVVVKLTPERLLYNVQKYIEDRKKKDINKEQIHFKADLLEEIEMIRD